MKKTLYLVLFFILFNFFSSVNAANYLASYTTQISAKDRYSTSGRRYKSVRSILRQDRVNFYAFYNRDSIDGSDGFFVTKANRELFNTAQIAVNPDLEKKIIGNGPVTITVFVISASKMEVVSAPSAKGVY